jgi:hypothetical protein
VNGGVNLGTVRSLPAASSHGQQAVAVTAATDGSGVGKCATAGLLIGECLQLTNLSLVHILVTRLRRRCARRGARDVRKQCRG